MAFADLSPNQAVSFTDAQSGGFALKSGQSNATSNQCMTKNDALTKYNLSTSPMASYVDNQLVPKNVWISGVVGNAITIYLGDHGSNATCTFHPSSNTVYSSSTIISQGIVLYNDVSMSSIYTSSFTHYDTVSNSLFTVNASGVVSVLTSCVTSYRYSGQRGRLTCVGGQVALFNPSAVTVYSANKILMTDVYLYNDAQLTQPYALGNVIRIAQQIWYLDGSGMIYSYSDVGDPC